MRATTMKMKNLKMKKTPGKARTIQEKMKTIQEKTKTILEKTKTILEKTKTTQVAKVKVTQERKMILVVMMKRPITITNQVKKIILEKTIRWQPFHPRQTPVFPCFQIRVAPGKYRLLYRT